MRFRVVNPWAYSLNGYDIVTVDAGVILGVSDTPKRGEITPELARGGVSTGHLEPETLQKAPKNKSFRRAPERK
jgi:hypothetical protein